MSMFSVNGEIMLMYKILLNDTGKVNSRPILEYNGKGDVKQAKKMLEEFSSLTKLKFGGLTFFSLDQEGFPKMEFWYQYKDGVFGKRNQLIF